MADLRSVITEAKLDSVHTVYENGKKGLQKFLCFTRLVDENWILATTDGIDMWRREIDFDELDSHRDISGVSNMDAYLTKIRNGFTSGSISVSRIGTKVTLTVGAETSTTLDFDLYEAKAADKKVELQTVLFRLADMTSNLEKELSSAQVQIKNLKAQKGADAGKNTLFDLGPKKGANPAKAKPKKAGMSVLNPTSRKRRAAKGVEFD